MPTRKIHTSNCRKCSDFLKTQKFSVLWEWLLGFFGAFFFFVRKEIKKGYSLENQMQMIKLGFWMCVLIDEDCQKTGMNKCSFTLYTSELDLSF